MPAEPNRIQILQAEIDSDGESDIRLLLDKDSIKYLKIDEGIYPTEDMCFGPRLAELLPDIPAGDWNLYHISQHLTPDGKNSMTLKKEGFPSVTCLWHPLTVEYLELHIGSKLRSKIYEANTPKLDTNFMVKFARFPWEIDYIDSETSVYAILEGSGIGPRFLGHVKEGDRVIGFMIEKITGFRHAEIGDLALCRKALAELHGMGIRHGDVNKHNFLIQGGRAVIIDFKSAERCSDKALLLEEESKLVEELQCTSGKGGCITEDLPL